MGVYGLLGEKLGHSYSPAIHAMLGDPDYALFARSPEELADFMAHGAWDGLNVTIPYKKAVIPYCTALSDTAREMGSVNTIVRRADGSLYGENTDAFGFASMVRCSGISVRERKVLVLGSGGASATVCAVLRTMGAKAVVISRRGRDNYENLSRHADAQVIVNATPVGMFPDNGAAPLDLTRFPRCEGVLDLIYNPARTALLLQAERLGIPGANGLLMLVAQAKQSRALFTGTAIADSEIERITRALSAGRESIVLVGMPGCGKSTVAAALGERLHRPVIETDQLIIQKAGISIPEIFRRFGEQGFRELEQAAVAQAGKQSGAIISTGGGCVTREENYPLLHQNGTILWLQRAIDRLPVGGRPISLQCDLSQLYQSRRDAYARFADYVVGNDSSVEEAVAAITDLLGQK